MKLSIYYRINPKRRRRIPPIIVDAPRTDGTPATGTFGVGVAVMPIAIVLETGTGVAVTMTVGRVGVGVEGQVQLLYEAHAEFLQRFTPVTVEHTSPDGQSLSTPHDASQ